MRKRLDRIYSVEAARRLARRVLPRAVFDYVDGGAEDEVTMARNRAAWQEIAFRPRMGIQVVDPDIATTVAGVDLSLPVLLAPCGLIRAMHPDGAIGVVQAARGAGTLAVVSTVAGTPPEDLCELEGPRWFQLYASNREVASELVGRARSAGFDGLMVTLDTPALGKRERDLSNGIPSPLRLDARSVLRLGAQVLARPGWSASMVSSGVRLGRRSSPPGSSAPTSAARVAMSASPFTWDDVAWMRERWQGPLIVKGVLTAQDARLALDCGADVVVVSNHGGRQLDGAPASARALVEVVDEVGSRCEVLVDGGIRRGGDVLKAIALGARAVLVGRPYLYGLAAGGRRGVERILEVIREEMERTMVLMGCRSLGELDRDWLEPTPPAQPEFRVARVRGDSGQT
jgi:L-lactate dehydrogenase (cytochrome)